jgi:hypothetical protein
MNPTGKTKSQTKSETVKQLLARDRGATLEEMIAATGWKPHSCRAFLSGVRKSGSAVLKLERTDGSSAWRTSAENQVSA